MNVSYADINKTRVLVDGTPEEAGHVPEVSYGTHFFQDLVEDEIVYLPVYPDDIEAQFYDKFFGGAANSLLGLLPDAKGFEECIDVIDVRASTAGLQAHVVADPHNQWAVCYLG